MYREAPNYRSAESYEGFRNEMARIPSVEVERQLELRFEDAATNFILTICDPTSLEEEVDLATLELALVAQADAEIHPDELDSRFHEPWISKARRKILDVCDEQFGDNVNNIVNSTVFFASDYMTQQSLKGISCGRTNPRFAYDDDTFATGVAMGRIGVSA